LFAGAMVLATLSGSVTLRAFSLLFGLGAGGACGVLAALMAHLSRAPARYEPIEGEAGAWGMMEYEERTRMPP
ncbi:MAG TPA: hypothetical protein VM582_01075, partial [Candidatus Thermoplasmatota archaeon]|nr:hypothetical protein [Candidatus Thermoplasmatota archaeon]